MNWILLEATLTSSVFKLSNTPNTWQLDSCWQRLLYSSKECKKVAQILTVVFRPWWDYGWFLFLFLVFRQLPHFFHEYELPSKKYKIKKERNFIKKRRKLLFSSSEKETSFMLWVWSFQDYNLIISTNRVECTRGIWGNGRASWLMRQCKR